MSTQTAAVSEIFSSLQGEGTHLGERHLFLRFEACNIHCEYCDELGKPGYGLDLDQTIESLKKLEQEKGPHGYVSLTGGEPLLYVSFLTALLPRLKQEGFKIYLETNGILWKVLEQVIHWCDVIAMDVKPASVTKERSFLKEHEQFLRLSLQKETFIKMIISKEIVLEEFQNLCSMISRVDLKVPLILQPISAEVDGHEDPDLMNLLSELQTVALGILDDVRIVPRLHKILGIR
ncbi:MAG: 7-carboxy-7-deazaguanine synthase QueE [Candidatus Omnitrophica bacterium]|nr:7-carboxy-7-deazaguanine synthase QueE [Candidatus Omnitrophota bacterium]